MNKKIRLVVMVLVIALSATLAQAEEIVYVQSLKAKIMAAASFKAKVVGEAARGYKLVAIAKMGTWIKVNYSGKEGYVSALLVSIRPPMEKLSLIKAEDTDGSHGVRRRASTYSSAAAARGLVQDDRRRLSKDEKIDYLGLEKVEAVTITNEDIVKFMEGGKL
jgi:hypothetical protein